MLKSAMEELMRGDSPSQALSLTIPSSASLIAPATPLLDYEVAQMLQGIDKGSMRLLSVAKSASGLSGRTLRKLPVRL